MKYIILYLFILISILYSSKSQYQTDISDSLWAIVIPEADARDIDMLQVLVGSLKDSIVTEFVSNKGSWEFTVDSIYFQGPDADAFLLMSGLPQYSVAPNTNYYGEFRFVPNRVGLHNAEIVVITQSDTLYQNIRGEGVEPWLEVVTDIIDFGDVYVGQYRDSLQAITIKNISTSPIDILKTEYGGPNFIDFTTLAGGESFVLQPGDTHKMDLRFAPSAVGRTSGTLQFHYDGVGSPTVVHLFGRGVVDEIEILALSVDAYPADIVDVPIILNKGEDLHLSGVTSLRVDLIYNSTLLFPLNHPPQYINETISKVSLYNLPVNIKSGDTLTTVKFKVGLGNAERCDLELSNGRAIGAEVAISYINGIFTLLGVCYEGESARLLNPNSQAGLINITPNPAIEKLQIDFSLYEKGYTEIVLLNYLGETVKTVFSENVNKYGLRSEVVDLKDLSSGQYLLIFKTPTIIESKNIYVIK